MNIDDIISLIQTLPSSEELGLILRGIEKENMRVNAQGQIVKTPHPNGLGKALTNPSITVDFSEGLIEMVTPPHRSFTELYDYLIAVNRFTQTQMGDEYLWPLSMPPQIDNELDVRIADFGTSDKARMKQVYRAGLWHRYGRIMQAIGGIHYNFSFSDDLLKVLQKLWKKDALTVQDFRSFAYMKIVQNFHCHAWIFAYLFGASPICFNSSAGGDTNYLERFDEESLYAPFGTSLRMSDLGYQSSAQDDLQIDFSSAKAYAKSLYEATKQSHPEYEKIGIKKDGEYQQLNANILQIENEFYSFIRPKPALVPGEPPSLSLCQNGVKYIEIRLLDLNPFSPLGVDKETLAFTDIILTYCLLCEENNATIKSYKVARDNFKTVATMGRKPDLHLQTQQGPRRLSEMADSLFERLESIAKWLDGMQETSLFQDALEKQKMKVQSPELTPSAQMINTIRSEKMSYQDFCIQQTLKAKFEIENMDYDKKIVEQIERDAKGSIDTWRELERAPKDFDAFLKSYMNK